MTTQLHPGTLKKVHAIMARAFGPDRAQQALEVWQRDYANRESFGVVNFVQEQGPAFGLNDASGARRLRLALFQILLVEAEPSASGATEHKSGSSAPEGTADTGGDALQARARVANTIVHRLARAARDTGELFHNVLAEEVDKAKLQQETAHALKTWDGSGEPALPAGDNATLRAAVTAVYIALCEDVGPARADHALKQAKRAAEELDESALAPPSEML